ncbi:MAG: alkaline phosphatase family protein [Polyangiaceae bacterium]|nr:alkaline phosphatase family protein [Polyangiaceae bacterium]
MSRHRSSGGKSRHVSRRTALKQLGLGIGVSAIGTRCVPPDRCEVGPEAPPLGPERDEYGQPTPRRLLAGIDTLIVVMMENRSFDHLFGMLARDPEYPARDLVDGLTGMEACPDDDGNPIYVHWAEHIDNYGPRHDWEGSREAYANGHNDGFVRTNVGQTRTDTMAYHVRSQLPLLYALADQYTVCDRWFSSVMGPTWPNRYYLHAATSGGLVANEPLTEMPATVWERLGKKCWSSKCYAAGPVHWYYGAFRGKSLAGNDPLVAAFIEDFFRDAREGTLPSFALIDPDFWSSDMHPPHSLALGEVLLGAIVRALQESPQWSRSLLVITFDEHGGFFDHVPPPTTVDPRPEFCQLGFRVPTVVVGPMVRHGAVVSTTLEHVSVAATLGTRFGIDTLGPRMDACADLSSCIDPALVAQPSGAVGKLPRLTLDWRRVLDVSRPSIQPGLEAAMRGGFVPEHLIDRRSLEQRLRALLRHAEELDVARVEG